MAIPSYKQININNSTKESINNQLDPHTFGTMPYLLNISHLSDQFEALSHIEDYLESKDLSNYPYPIYIISNIKNYHGPFSLFETINGCPGFFKQKIKQLNSRENKIIQKIYLKQKNLGNMQGHNFKDVLKNYSTNHKEVYNLHKEKKFLIGIRKQLEE